MFEAVGIFAMTYAIISGKKWKFIRVGRSAGVLLGAILMVIANVISPDQAYGLVNWDTIVLLLGMMIIIEHLAEAEFFKLVARLVNERDFNLRQLLFLEVMGLGILACFLVNDIVCIFFTPLLLIMIRERNIPPMPFLLALATSTNIGGLMAFTGNPQNMIIGSLSGISYGDYFLRMFPIGIIGLFINYRLILKLFKSQLDGEISEYRPDKEVKLKKRLRRSMAITIGVVISFFFFSNIAWVALAGATFLMFLSNKDEGDILSRVDWNLLLFFSALFIVIGALHQSGVTDLLLSRMDIIFKEGLLNNWLFGITAILGSNLFANVPYVLIIAESLSGMDSANVLWYILAFSSTIAGNMTIIGAVANVIVVEKAKGICHIGFWDFVKFGVPSTIVNFVIGMLVISLYSILGII